MMEFISQRSIKNTVAAGEKLTYGGYLSNTFFTLYLYNNPPIFNRFIMR